MIDFMSREAGSRSAGKKIIIILSLILLAAGCNNSTPTQPTKPALTPTTTPTPPASLTHTEKLVAPINNASSRITKKTFGLYVTPKNSPVQPEKFTGYHTGVDFETTKDEQDVDVKIFAACNGKLLMKKYATGYGGMAVQSCKLDGNDVTIIYGHLRLASITPKVGDELQAGDELAVLGTGYSTETDGERKHLHFGIHKGTSINILGYVQKENLLSDWLDAEQYLK